jgi:hypothetical protein
MYVRKETGSSTRKHTDSSSCFRTKLSLQNWNRGVDSSHTEARNYSSNDHVGSSVCSCLEKCSYDHDNDASSDGLPSPKLLSDGSCCDRAQETSDYNI